MAAQAEKQGIQRRAEVRVDVDHFPIEVWVSRLVTWEQVQGQILNISAGGALIELSHPLPVGLDVRCRFDLAEERPPEQNLYSLTTTVVRVNPARASVYHMGMRFEFGQEKGRDMLVRWVFNEIARRQRLWLDGVEQKRQVGRHWVVR